MPNPPATRSGPELVALGVVARPHGVRGELRVHLYNPESTLLYEVDEVVLRDGDGALRTGTVEHARRGPKGALLLTLEEIDDRSEAEAARGVEVCVPRRALPEPDEGEWYHVDLIGLVAVSPEGQRLGEVVDVVQYPTVGCLRIRSSDGDREVPMVDGHVGAIDLDAGRVVVAALDTVPLLPEPKRRDGA